MTFIEQKTSALFSDFLTIRITCKFKKFGTENFFVSVTIYVFLFFFSDGIAFSYGRLLIPLLESFDSSRSVISNGGSLMFGFYLLSSPISGVLIKKFGCRIVCIAGCIIGALGIGLSSLSPNAAILMLSYGVVGGYGLGTMNLPSKVVISNYFEKKRGLATGMDYLHIFFLSFLSTLLLS